jgi:excisionase family DNA binding protein
MLLMSQIDRELAALPLAQVPNLIAMLAALTAKANLRMMTAPGPVAREAENLLTAPEVAKRLNLSADTVYELCRQGKVRSHKCGKSLRIPPSAVADYLAEQRP